MRDVLTGNKLYFKNIEVPCVYVQKMENLTLKNVLDKVYDVAAVRQYLPDFEDNPEKNLSRDFVFAIVNKIDPTFFARLTDELRT